MNNSLSDKYDSARGGIGMITSSSGEEIFFHVKSAEDGGPRLKPGQRVSYELARGEDGRCYAINIEVADDDE